MIFFNKKRKRRYEQTIKKVLRSYFGSISPNYLFQMQITDIQVVVRKWEIEAIITLCKPGLLIGVEGRILDDVSEYIQRRLEKPFRITIKESKLWQ